MSSFSDSGLRVGIVGATHGDGTVGLAGGTIAFGSFVKLLDWWADRPAGGAAVAPENRV